MVLLKIFLERLHIENIRDTYVQHNICIRFTKIALHQYINNSAPSTPARIFYISVYRLRFVELYYYVRDKMPHIIQSLYYSAYEITIFVGWSRPNIVWVTAVVSNICSIIYCSDIYFEHSRILDNRYTN